MFEWLYGCHRSYPESSTWWKNLPRVVQEALNQMDRVQEKSCALRAEWSTHLRAEGPDALSFLQGQWSQDLRGASVTRAARGLWLDRKGRVFADSWIYEGKSPSGGRCFEVLSDTVETSRLRARLEAFLIADEVELIDGRAPLPMWSVPRSTEGVSVLEALGIAGAGGEVAEGTVLAGATGVRVLAAAFPWGEPCWRLWSEAGDPAEVARLDSAVAAAGLCTLNPLEAEWLRIEAGRARVPVDCGETDLPGEAELDSPCVSYGKGCFIGQEVLARLRAQGTLRRGLRRVRGDGALPATPVALFDGERKIGELRSVAPAPPWASAPATWSGLALVTLAGLPARASAGAPGGALVHFE